MEHIYYKISVDIVEILCKDLHNSTNIVQRLQKYYASIAQILYISYKNFVKNYADVFLTYDKQGANIMQY